MEEYGMLKDVNVLEDKVILRFEKSDMEIRILTDQIIRFVVSESKVCPKSKAIETEKKQEVSFEVQKNDTGVCIITKMLMIQINNTGEIDIFDSMGEPVCLDYRGERKITQGLGAKDTALLEQEGHDVLKNPGKQKNQIVKKMFGDECFYGLGDKTGFLNKRGYVYANWNTDNPAPQTDAFTQLYKSIPYMIVLRENHVFGLFYDTTYCSHFDLGKESEEYYWFGSDRGMLDYYFIGGENMKEVLQGYVWLTGTAPLPQMWTLGYHQSRFSYRNEAEVRELAVKFRENDLPCDVIHLDIDYMDSYKVFTIDPKSFPNMKKLTLDLQKTGIKLVTIIDPGVKAENGYQVYEEGCKGQYFALDPDGSIYKNIVWPGESAYPDFGKKNVRSWWGTLYQKMTDQGISGIWLDMNEPASFQGEIEEDVVFYDEERKTTHAEMHNVYGHLMAKATYEGLKNITDKRPFVITRACYSGSQKYTIAWTGDNHSIWAHLQMAIPQMCNMGLSGMPYIGTDIGGFGSDTTKELLCRWIQVGSLSPFCRNHASAGTRRQEPWAFDEETLRIYRKYLKLRYQLLPYFYDLCREQEKSGLPIMRPLVLEFEKDQNVRNMNTQFMLGETVLIAPVVEQGAVKKLVYLPEGEWYDFWTMERHQGKCWIMKEAPLEVCPIYIRVGSMIPMYEEGGLSVSQINRKKLVLHVYSDGQDCEYTHYQDNGEDFKYQEGEYNLYHFKYIQGVFSTEMLYEGYVEKYGEIEVVSEERQ